MLESHLLRQPVSSIVLIKGFHCRALPGNTQTHKRNYLNVFISMLVHVAGAVAHLCTSSSRARPRSLQASVVAVSRSRCSVAG